MARNAENVTVSQSWVYGLSEVGLGQESEQMRASSVLARGVFVLQCVLVTFFKLWGVLGVFLQWGAHAVGIQSNSLIILNGFV